MLGREAPQRLATLQLKPRAARRATSYPVHVTLSARRCCRRRMRAKLELSLWSETVFGWHFENGESVLLSVRLSEPGGLGHTRRVWWWAARAPGGSGSIPSGRRFDRVLRNQRDEHVGRLDRGDHLSSVVCVLCPGASDSLCAPILPIPMMPTVDSLTSCPSSTFATGRGAGFRERTPVDRTGRG